MVRNQKQHNMSRYCWVQTTNLYWQTRLAIKCMNAKVTIILLVLSFFLHKTIWMYQSLMYSEMYACEMYWMASTPYDLCDDLSQRCCGTKEGPDNSIKLILKTVLSCCWSSETQKLASVISYYLKINILQTDDR